MRPDFRGVGDYDRGLPASMPSRQRKKRLRAERAGALRHACHMELILLNPDRFQGKFALDVRNLLPRARTRRERHLVLRALRYAETEVARSLRRKHRAKLKALRSLRSDEYRQVDGFSPAGTELARTNVPSAGAPESPPHTRRSVTPPGPPRPTRVRRGVTRRTRRGGHGASGEHACSYLALRQSGVAASA